MSSDQYTDHPEKGNYYSTNYSYPETSSDNGNFYSKIMMWMVAAFGLMAVGTGIVGPFVPQSLIMPLSILTVVVLIAASFSRKVVKFSGLFATVIPFVLGITLYPTLNYYISNGMGNLVTSAAVGTAVIFLSMAALGWTSKKSLNSWAPKLFTILIGLIAVSLLNVFIFKLTGLSLIISIAAVALFAIYTYVDIQAIRDRSPHDNIPASFYALNIFLDIFNLFVNLLNILGILNRN